MVKPYLNHLKLKLQIRKAFFVGSMIIISTHIHAQQLKDFNFYLESNEVSKEAKDFYNNKFKASDDERTMSILDSLRTKNNSTRPFYLYLVSKMLIKADGAVAEVLGNTCKEFVEMHPNQYISFLSSDGISEKYLKNWAMAIAQEFMIVCEGTELKCINKSFEATLKKCTPKNQSKLT